jgi:hypothetical protein
LLRCERHRSRRGEPLVYAGRRSSVKNDFAVRDRTGRELLRVAADAPMCSQI